MEAVQEALAVEGISKTRKTKLKQHLKALEVRSCCVALSYIVAIGIVRYQSANPIYSQLLHAGILIHVIGYPF